MPHPPSYQVCMEALAENFWFKSYPLKVLGTDHGRNVSVIRLTSGKLIVHSMAQFSPADVHAIQALGTPGWLVEAMLLHDTYARDGRNTFPGIPFLAPSGFSDIVKFSTLPLLPAPPEWDGELEVFEIEGAPRLKEHAVLHIPSRTLIVADVIFNFPPEEHGWNRVFHRYVAGFKRYPGMSRVFRILIRDRAAFRATFQRILTADFDRIVVGHGRVIEKDGRALLERAIRDAGLI